MSWHTWVFVLEGVTVAVVIWGLVTLIRGERETSLPVRPAPTPRPVPKKAPSEVAVQSTTTAATPTDIETETVSTAKSLTDNAHVSLTKATDRP